MLTLDIEVLEGWHAYDQVPAGQAYQAMAINLDLPSGVRLVGEWDRPKSDESERTKGLRKWRGSLQFQATLEMGAEVATDAEIVCRVGFQVCNAEQCMRPKQESQTLSVNGDALSSDD